MAVDFARRTVLVDCLPEAALKYRESHVVVAVDVIRASTTISTAVSLGRRVLPVRSTDDAFILGKGLTNPLYVGELGGNVPFGFDVSNSPAAIALRTDNERPMIFISSSGTRLMLNAYLSRPVLIACFRNVSAVVRHIVESTSGDVAVLGAGTRGEFRREDQMCCAWIAEGLVKGGLNAADPETVELIRRWSGASPGEAANGNSAAYLRRSGQLEDLDFVISHIDDLDIVPALVDGEIKRMELI